MMDKPYDDLFKILVLGDLDVGKTRLHYRISQNVFMERLPLWGTDFRTKIVVIDGKRIKLQLWDTAGQERFGIVAFTHNFYNITARDGIIFAYDITNKESLSNVKVWLQNFYNKHPDPDNVCKLLVGTKCDLISDGDEYQMQTSLASCEEHNDQFQQQSPSGTQSIIKREVDYITAVEFAREHKLIGAFETSAKESINVELAFMTLAAAILVKREDLGSTDIFDKSEQSCTPTSQEGVHWTCSVL